MAIESKKYLIIAFRELMRPIIRLILRNGLMYREFMQICKSLYIEVASQEYGVRGRETNISRVALLTGLDRKEVKRIRDLLAQPGDIVPDQHNADRISRVLSGWYTDPAYMEQQHPMSLPIEGDCVSFNGLVKKYGSDVPASTMLKEFKRTGVVVQEGNSVRAVKAYYIPDNENHTAIHRMASIISDITRTLYHNFYREDKNLSPRFERCAVNLEVNPDCLPQFHEYLAEKGQRFLEDLDAWLSNHEVNDKTSQEKVRLGVGAYCIQGDNNIQVMPC